MKEPDRWKREAERQASLNTGVHASRVGVRREPVEDALKYLTLYWDHEHDLLAGLEPLNPQRFYLERADASLRDALNEESR